MSYYPDVLFEAYNEDVHSERKKSYAVKSHFAARKNPFCGVFEDNIITKGFYSEAKECTEQAIADYMLDKYAAVRIEPPEAPESPEPVNLDELVFNYKSSHSND